SEGFLAAAAGEDNRSGARRGERLACLDSVLGTSTATTTTKSPDTFYVPGDLNCALLFFLRGTGGTGASLCTLTCLHFHFCGRHRVSDFYFFADLEVALQLVLLGTICFPPVRFVTSVN